MTAEEFLVQMRRVLTEERDAIRHLDVKSVAAAGVAKEEILKAAVQAATEDRKAFAAALAELKGELRRNLVLLAHARDYLRDAITLCTQQKPSRPRLQASL